MMDGIPAPSDLGGAAARSLGRRISSARKSREMTLKSLSHGCGLSISTLSRIENGLLSITYDNMIAIAGALDRSVVDLLRTDAEPARTRRSISTAGSGDIYDTAVYHYQMLHTDLLGRRMTPIRAVIKAHTRQDFGSLKAHAGEEFFFVLSGQVELLAEHYAPAVLGPGDSAYFDSTMGHALISLGSEDAEIVWVATNV